MTLHEMSISAIQKALGTGELSAGEIARQTLESIDLAPRRSPLSKVDLAQCYRAGFDYLGGNACAVVFTL